MFRSQLRTSILSIASAALLAACTLGAHAQKVKASISFAQPTAGITVNSLTNRIYVVAPSFGGASDTLAVIDGKTNKIIQNISIPVGAYLPVVDLLTNVIYVASCNPTETEQDCFISVIAGWNNKYLGRFEVTKTLGDGLLGLAVDPFNNKLYISNASDGVVDVMGGFTGQILTKYAVTGGEPIGLSVNPYTGLLYVPLGNNELDIFDTKKKSLIATSTVGSTDSFAAVNVATGNVFVTNSLAGPSTTEVIDKTGESVASVPVGDTPYGVDVDPITNKAFVASTALNNVTVIDGKTNTAIATVSNVSADFVAVDFVTATVYVSGTTGVTVLSEK